MSFLVTKLIKSWSWASPPGLQNSQIHVLTLCHMTAEQEEGVRCSKRMGSWLEGLSLNLATVAAIDLEFRLKFSNPHFIFHWILMEFYYNYTVGASHPWILFPWIQPTTGQKYLKKKNPESSEMQNLNVLYTGNDLPSIYMIFPASDIAFTFYQVL